MSVYFYMQNGYVIEDLLDQVELGYMVKTLLPQ